MGVSELRSAHWSLPADELSHGWQTPLLQTEHIRLLEQHVDFIVADGTDYVRAGAHEDGGITGAMKIAHASEGFGLDMELHGPSPAHRHTRGV